MKGQKVGYVRVSSVEQNTGRQLEGIEVDRIFVDRASGKNTDRPKFQEMLNYVREGDRVIFMRVKFLQRRKMVLY